MLAGDGKTMNRQGLVALCHFSTAAVHSIKSIKELERSSRIKRAHSGNVPL